MLAGEAILLLKSTVFASTVTVFGAPLPDRRGGDALRQLTASKRRIVRRLPRTCRLPALAG
ncbi:hypothetical protein [Burkholderia sp. IDO3]|uniref:hypothetical protein n=1 Tax=Burkholderia sp. IDO3 TaxID=1705310 RepID=UPI001F07EE0D|nr:hypothetical protein [Burkholderia sp. IDO3]